MINNMITDCLKKYNLHLTDLAVQSIRVQIELLYGIHPTYEQVEEIVNDTRIGIIKEYNSKFKPTKMAKNRGG